MRFGSCALLALLLAPSIGCGVGLDFDPPDPPKQDASAGDLGGGDAGLSDGGTSDAAPDMFFDLGHDAGPRDLGPDALPSPCVGMPMGAPCSSADAGGGRLICIASMCVSSACGDGFIDTVAGEDCEPSLDPTCGATCRYACTMDSDCADPPTTCQLVACVGHMCTYPPDPSRDGHGCVIGSVTSGVCRSGLCVLPGCGNGIMDSGEDCDPGMGLTAPGCVGCHFVCRMDADCVDTDACNGIEHCMSVTTGGVPGRLCQPGAAFGCVPRDACHASMCVGATPTFAMCREVLIDGDMDGHAPATLGACGDDCNDADPFIHPGAPEVCNGLDDNCNGMIDEGTMSVRWCFDGDGDGFGDPTMSVMSCAPPPGGGFVRDCTDCFDRSDPATRDLAAQVNPAQTGWFSTPYCRMPSPTGPTFCSFDYNCDGVDTEQYPAVVNCGALSPLICNGSTGWSGSVPACGETGSWAMCMSVAFSLLCRTAIADVPQACH